MKQIIIAIIVATLWGCKNTPTSDNDVKEKPKVEVDTTKKHVKNDVDSLLHKKKKKKKWKRLSIVGSYGWDGYDGTWDLAVEIDQNEDSLFFIITSVAYNGRKLRTYGYYDKTDIMKFVNQIPKGYPKTFRIWLPLQQFDQKDDSGWAILHFIDKNTIKWKTEKDIAYLPRHVTLKRYR